MDSRSKGTGNQKAMEIIASLKAKKAAERAKPVSSEVSRHKAEPDANKPDVLEGLLKRFESNSSGQDAEEHLKRISTLAQEIFTTDRDTVMKAIDRVIFAVTSIQDEEMRKRAIETASVHLYSVVAACSAGDQKAAAELMHAIAPIVKREPGEKEGDEPNENDPRWSPRNLTGVVIAVRIAFIEAEESQKAKEEGSILVLAEFLKSQGKAAAGAAMRLFELSEKNPLDPEFSQALPVIAQAALKQRDGRVAGALAGTLGRLAAANHAQLEAVFPTLLEMTKDMRAPVINGVRYGLVMCGKPAVRLLAESAANPDLVVRMHCVLTLGEIYVENSEDESLGRETILVINRALDDPMEPVRKVALVSMERIIERVKNLKTATLAGLLNCGSPMIAEFAAKCLHERSESDPGNQEFAEALPHVILASRKLKEEPALCFLAKVIGNVSSGAYGNPDLANDSVHALLEMAKIFPDCLPANQDENFQILVGKSNKEGRYLTWNVRQALMRVGKPALEILVARASDPDERVRWHCIEVLGWLVSDYPDDKGVQHAAKPVLKKALNDPDERIREEAGLSLEAIKEKKKAQEAIIKTQTQPSAKTAAEREKWGFVGRIARRLRKDET